MGGTFPSLDPTATRPMDSGGAAIFQQAGADNLVEPSQQHLARLRALWELSLDRQNHGTQIEGLLQEARSALQCDYAELWNARSEQRVAYAGSDASRSLGALVIAEDVPADEQAMFVLEPGEDAQLQATLRRAGKSALLVRRFETGRDRYAILFAWSERRPRTLSHAEEQYLDFLQHVVSRVLVLADKHRELHDRISIDPLTGLQNRAVYARSYRSSRFVRAAHALRIRRAVRRSERVQTGQ